AAKQNHDDGAIAVLQRARRALDRAGFLESLLLLLDVEEHAAGADRGHDKKQLPEDPHAPSWTFWRRVSLPPTAPNAMTDGGFGPSAPLLRPVGQPEAEGVDAVHLAHLRH